MSVVQALVNLAAAALALAVSWKAYRVYRLLKVPRILRLSSSFLLLALSALCQSAASLLPIGYLSFASSALATVAFALLAYAYMPGREAVPLAATSIFLYAQYALEVVSASCASVVFVSTLMEYVDKRKHKAIASLIAFALMASKHALSALYLAALSPAQPLLLGLLDVIAYGCLLSAVTHG